MIDELIRPLIKFPSVVSTRSHISAPRDTFDLGADGLDESLEPIVLSEGVLSADRARDLVEQAMEGTSFAADDLGRVEVLHDHRRARHQTMLVREGFLSNCPSLCILNTALVGVLLHGRPGYYASAIVGLAEDRLDVVFYGDRYECMQRFVVIATQQQAASRHDEHPAVRQLRDCIGRLTHPPG